MELEPVETEAGLVKTAALAPEGTEGGTAGMVTWRFMVSYKWD